MVTAPVKAVMLSAASATPKAIQTTSARFCAAGDIQTPQVIPMVQIPFAKWKTHDSTPIAYRKGTTKPFIAAPKDDAALYGRNCPPLRGSATPFIHQFAWNQPCI